MNRNQALDVVDSAPYSIWRRLIEIDAFLDYYPQRIQACYQCLVNDGKQVFSLKVIADYIFSLNCLIKGDF